MMEMFTFFYYQSEDVNNFASANIPSLLKVTD